MLNFYKTGYKVTFCFILSTILLVISTGNLFASERQVIVTKAPLPGVPIVKMVIAPLPGNNNPVDSENNKNEKSTLDWNIQIRPLPGKSTTPVVESPTASPNLTPYQPSGWDSKIVVNSTAPTSDSDVHEGSVSADQNCYVSFAVANTGDADASTPFYSRLYDSGTVLGTMYVQYLPVNYYAYVLGGAAIFHAAGTRTLQLTADYTGVVSESNESDNTYTRTKTIYAPNLVYYQPSGWDSPMVISSAVPTSISNVKEGNTFVNQTCYINGAIINNGTGSVSGTFYAYFYDNGVVTGGGIVSSGLAAGSYAYATGIPYVFQTSGTHTLSMVADSQNYVTETSETDNTYSRLKLILGVPTAPSNLSVTVVSNTQIKLNWTDNSNNESGFGVDYKVNNGNWQGLTYMGTNTQTITDTGLTPGNEYCYRVYAYNNFGISGYTNENCAIPWVWNNSMGDLDSADDTTYWSFETPAGVSVRPAVTYLSSYQGHSGVLQFGFTTASQGVKLTSLGRFTPNFGNPWHHLQITYYSDTPSNGHEILPVVLLYSNFSSNAIKELGANYTGNSLIQSGSWHTIDTYVYCHSSSGQLQFILKNRGSYGDMYIDSIVLSNENPPAVSNPTTVSFSFGDFDADTDTTEWGFENAPNVSNGQPNPIWLSDYSGQTGIFGLSFTTTNQGVKMTAKNLLEIPAGANVIMSFKVFSDVTNPSELNISGFQYGEKDKNTYIWDIGAYASIGILPGNTWTTYYVPLTSSSQTTNRLQFVIKNSSQFPETVYLDDIQVFYNTATLSPRIEEGLKSED